ncbi:MAG: DUF5658 family protein [Methylomonas sp.]|jgi:uncharacterized membrane protein|uniref:DUF5658 family protein n=1 Tax=Methylomonas sp. TaxID=418 RepID=UPI0025E2DEF7|nr:DUF5658 family protein [Methylomonas sp.]MCK9607016.1 DUF5658 family protein [Methylomonas sp.]
MSASETSIEQCIDQAGRECHDLIQAFHDRLKADYIGEKQDTRLAVMRITTQASGFLTWRVHAPTTLRQKLNTALLTLFGGLQVADGILTYLGLRFAELTEVNPLLNYVTGLLGLGVSITLLKLAILGVITAIFTTRRTIKRDWGTVALALAVIAYCGVNISNALLITGL